MAVSGAGGDSFGTSASSSRLSAAAFGTPGRGKTIERLQRIRIGRQRFRRRQRRRIGIADPDQNIEQRRRHDAAQRHVVGRLGILPCAISALCARGGALEAGDALVDRRTDPARRRIRAAPI